METRHEACSGRASLATASLIIRTDSRRAASRCHAGVIALSTAVMHFEALFPKFSTRRVQAKREDPGMRARWIAGSSPARTLCKSIIAPFATPFRVNEVPTRRCILHRSGTGARRLHQFKTTLRSCAVADQSPLSDIAACSKDRLALSGLFDDRGLDRARSEFAMLSVPTLWTAYVVNFLALGLVWAYVVRSYPKFGAARFWTGSALTAAAGAVLAMLRMFMDSLLPLLVAATILIFAACLAAMGVKRFSDRPVSWRGTMAVAAPARGSQPVSPFALPPSMSSASQPICCLSAPG